MVSKFRMIKTWVEDKKEKNESYGLVSDFCFQIVGDLKPTPRYHPYQTQHSDLGK